MFCDTLTYRAARVQDRCGVQPVSNRAAHPHATPLGSNRGISVTRSVAGHQVTLDAHMDNPAILTDYIPQGSSVY